MIFKKRPEEQALGDRLVREEKAGAGPGVGISVEPPGFFKRLFSVPRNVRRTVSVNDVVVPVIGARDGWGNIRQGLVDRGIYPGVEYRMLDITLVPSNAAEGEPSSSLETAREAPEGAFETGELFFTMRPVYPLVGRLERPWPVRVPARDFPVLLEPFYYNAATAWAALTTSLTFLALGFVFSQALTFSVIPSRSMEPTLQVGDVVLVEKVSRSLVVRRNDIVFFSPPPALRQVVADAGGTLGSRDLFVKRVAAVPGDKVTVSANGRVRVVAPSHQGANAGVGATGPAARRAQEDVSPGTTGEELDELPDAILERIQTVKDEAVARGEVFVLGDNPAVSMDSRVWGQLDERDIVGHPLIRIFPLTKFGPLS